MFSFFLWWQPPELRWWLLTTGSSCLSLMTSVGHLYLFEKHPFRQFSQVLVGSREALPLSCLASVHFTVTCPLPDEWFANIFYFVGHVFLVSFAPQKPLPCAISSFVCFYFVSRVVGLAYPPPPPSPLLCPRSSFLFHHPEDFLLEVSQFGWSNTEERGSALSWQWLTRILFCGHGPLWCWVSCV